MATPTHTHIPVLRDSAGTVIHITIVEKNKINICFAHSKAFNMYVNRLGDPAQLRWFASVAECTYIFRSHAYICTRKVYCSY
jgi:hypothetical protein